MISTLMIFHAVISVLLILMVLLQFGKGAEAGLMSGGGSEAVFTGSQQGNILSKITVVLAILFLGNSILLAKLQSKHSSKTLFDNAPKETKVKEIPKQGTHAAATVVTTGTTTNTTTNTNSSVATDVKQAIETKEEAKTTE